MDKDEVNENDKEKILINTTENKENIEQFETDKVEYSTKKNIYIF